MVAFFLMVVEQLGPKIHPAALLPRIEWALIDAEFLLRSEAAVRDGWASQNARPPVGAELLRRSFLIVASVPESWMPVSFLNWANDLGGYVLQVMILSNFGQWSARATGSPPGAPSARKQSA